MLARTVSSEDNAVTTFLKDGTGFSPADIVVALEHTLPNRRVTLGIAAFSAHTTFVHCFELTKGFLARRAAECLLNYCRGAARAAGFKEALFVVAAENEAMQRFLEEHGATKQKQGIVYTMEVR